MIRCSSAACSVASRAIAPRLSNFGAAHQTVRPLALYTSLVQQQRTLFGRNTPVNLGVMFVPEREAWVVERMGRFQRVLPSGLAFLIPVLDRIAYVHSLKVVAYEIEDQTAITRDNVVLNISGVLYYQIYDPEQASYNIDDPEFAIHQLAMSTMRSEIGKLSLEKTFEERNQLNEKIVEAINVSAHDWGMKCLRYEIRDLNPPKDVLEAMKLQVIAERKKREQIIISEGDLTAEVNNAEGNKQARVLAAEGERQEIELIQRGEANGYLTKAKAMAEGIRLIADAIQSPNGKDAVSLRLAEQYIDAFKELAKKSNTLILPSNVTDVSSIVTQATAVYNKINAATSKQDASAIAKDLASTLVEQENTNHTEAEDVPAPEKRTRQHDKQIRL
eukprot:TRINITY_DN7897_c0_g1_i1.p1 TRINITY_DN7897_c0_g1~~TRINITY_DN7897_c0_g1_i1.p1  ORF type:complete len:389 (-),score=97.76 TRINITY_DN7897_c0_g1_i1:86-1252(-)